MTKKPKRKQPLQAMYGGYVTWSDRYGREHREEVRVSAASSIVDDDCGAGTRKISCLLKARATKLHGPNQYVVEESWRYNV